MKKETVIIFHLLSTLHISYSSELSFPVVFQKKTHFSPSHSTKNQNATHRHTIDCLFSYDELPLPPPNGHQPPPPLLLSVEEVVDVPPIENVVSCPPASNRSLSPSPPPPPIVIIPLVEAVESPVGIMPSPPEMGGAVISLTGGPMAMAFGSVKDDDNDNDNDDDVVLQVVVKQYIYI